MTDQDVRDFLERMAAEEPAPFLEATPLIRRARRRAGRSLAVAALGVAAAIAVMFAGASHLRGAPPNVPASPAPPTVSPSPSAFTERFDSPLNGLSIGYPSGWKTRAATEAWGHDAMTFHASDADVIFDPQFRGDVYLAVVSEPLGGKSPMDWVYDTSMDRGLMSRGICKGGGGGGIGNGFQGYFAWFEYAHEPHNALCHRVFFATSSRGYIIYLHVADERHLLTTYDEPWFWSREGVLSTVELPEEAPTTLRPSGSP